MGSSTYFEESFLAIEDTNSILDSLRNLKSSIEGTLITFCPITIDHDQLATLRHLVLSHTPSNLHEETKTKISEKLTVLLKGQVKRIVYACIITCHGSQPPSLRFLPRQRTISCLWYMWPKMNSSSLWPHPMRRNCVRQ